MDKNISVKEQFSSFLKTLHQYTELLRWLIIDSVWRFRGKVILMLVTGVLHVILQVQAIGLAIYYARAVDKGIVINILGRKLSARTSLELLFFYGLGVLVCLLISAFFGYYSRTRVLKLWRLYEEFCSKRIFLLSGSNLRFCLPLSQEYNNESNILRLVRSDARYCGRILGMFLYTIIPIITFLIAIAILFYINTFLTILIIVLMIISTIFLYKINRSGVSYSTSLHKYTREFGQEYRHIIKWQKGIVISSPLSELEFWLEENIFRSGAVKQYLDAFEGRLRVVVESEFIGNIFFAIATCIVLISLGSFIVLQGKGWSQLIIYLVASRQGLLSFKEVTRKMTSINRFYPHLKRYSQFLKNMNYRLITKQENSTNYSIGLSNNSLPNSLEECNLNKGSCLGLVSPVELNCYTLAFLTECLLGNREVVSNVLESMRFATTNYSLPSKYPLSKSLGFPSGYNYQDLCQDMKLIGLEDKVKKQLRRNLEKPISQDKWNQVDLDLKFALSLTAALNSNCQWVMLDESGLKTLSKVAQENLLKRLSRKITIIIFNKKLARIGQYNENAIAVINENKLVGLGSLDWFNENKDEIETIWSKSSQKIAKVTSTRTDSSDFEDDLDDV